MWETWVRSLGWEDPLEEGMATHSSTLAWRTPWTEEPGGLQSMGSIYIQSIVSAAEHCAGQIMKPKCWSWNSDNLATWCEELTHLKRAWCWERLGAGGEGDDPGWDGWMASLTQWTWVWVNSSSWWWTRRPGVLQFMGLQIRTRLSDWTELIAQVRFPERLMLLSKSSVSYTIRKVSLRWRAILSLFTSLTKHRCVKLFRTQFAGRGRLAPSAN